MKDYSKLTDLELNNLTDPTINKGGIPLMAVVESQKRFPKEYTSKKTLTTSDFDKNGKFIK